MRRSTKTFLYAPILGAAVLSGWAAMVARSDAADYGMVKDLRAAYALPQDIAEGKHVAQKSCASCHGINGIATAKGVPHIGGQRAPYLYFELKNYQAGVRSNAAMSGAVKFIADDALIDVAAYYASLDPPAPTAASLRKPEHAKPDPVSAGKAAAAGCAGCHGETGITETAGMPNLVGQDPKYIVAAISSYKNGQRKSDVMKALVSGLGEKDMKNLALYFALQKPARAKTPATGDVAAGKAAAEACAGCHGEEGVSSTPTTPSLAGQDAQYFAAALQGYKDGSRADPTMKGLAVALDGATIKNLSAYYASLTPRAPKVMKPQTTAELAAKCDRCHGVNGNSTDVRIPALAAQRADYLEHVLLAYQSGARKSPEMEAMTAVLSEEHIAGLAAHYARQKARAVLYLPLPAK
jgi:cytochrome c553